MFDKAKNSLFEFYRFPEEIRASLYTTNLIERSNKGLKHLPKVKEQFPNETSLDRFVCSYYSEANRTRTVPKGDFSVFLLSFLRCLSRIPQSRR